VAFEQPLSAVTFGTTATKTTSMVANTKMVRFIDILLRYVLAASQFTALQYPCFDLCKNLAFAILPSIAYTFNRP
jgi:hypothetical protein